MIDFLTVSMKDKILTIHNVKDVKYLSQNAI